MIMMMIIFFIESFPQMCFEGKWLQNRLRADKNEPRSLLAVDIQGHERGGFCMMMMMMIMTTMITMAYMKLKIILATHILVKIQRVSELLVLSDFTNGSRDLRR